MLWNVLLPGMWFLGGGRQLLSSTTKKQLNCWTLSSGHFQRKMADFHTWYLLLERWNILMNFAFGILLGRLMMWAFIKLMRFWWIVVSLMGGSVVGQLLAQVNVPQVIFVPASWVASFILMALFWKKIKERKLRQKAILTLETLCSYEEVTDEYNKETRKKVYTRNNITLLERFREEPYRVLWHYPTGLRHRISMFLELFCNVIVDDATVNELPKPYLSFPGHPKYPARDYQSSIADKASAIKYATIVKPTGSGKTRTAAEIIRLMRVNTLFLTNSRLLLSQTSIAFRETLNTEIGIIGGGTFNIKPVTVATSQSIWALLTKQEGDGEKLTRDEKRQVMRSLKDKIKDLKINNILLEETDERTQLIQYLASVDLQFVDEAHGLGAEYSYLVGSLTNPCMSMGLTATSQREDEKDILMEAATGAIWRPVKEEQLIKDGYLLPVKVIVVPFQHKQKGIAKGRNKSKLNAQMITGNAERNQLIANLCTHYSQKYKTLVLTKEIEHGQGLAGLIGTTFISSKDKKLQAEAILGLINGTLKSLVSSPILEQGVDI